MNEKRVVSFWVVIILKFHLNGFFGECDIWAIFQSQNHYSSKALLWGLLLQNLVFWQLICYLSAKSHWWQGHKWNDWWALGTWWLSWKSVFSLFLLLKREMSILFSLISFSKDFQNESSTHCLFTWRFDQETGFIFCNIIIMNLLSLLFPIVL